MMLLPKTSSQQNNMSVAVIEWEGINDVVAVKGPCSLCVYSQMFQITGPSVSTAVPQVVILNGPGKKNCIHSSLM